MSVNSPNIALLKALSKAFYREADAAAHAARVNSAETANSVLLRRLSSACNEAGEQLREDDRLREEAMQPAPGAPIFTPRARGAKGDNR